MNLLTLLQGDLRALSLEAKKKFPNVKEAAEVAIVKLRPLEKKEKMKCIDEIARMDEVVKVIAAAFESKSPRLLSLAIPLAQKLLSANAVTQHNLEVLLRLLATMTSGVSDELQVKTLQTLTTLVTTNQGLHGPLLASSLETSFVLHNTGGPAVRNAAGASLPVVLSTLFDRAAAEIKAKGTSAFVNLFMAT
eukprot:TRINITY_DN1226_c0_g4_i2.p1 TRINITY_DN1226_c0_g4~~TRINITY_DN1226_c0_g4_i2.p1  ORF type:complete len:192 (-),score=64.29 TRINITY_DN1226_c0_g4_i2:376-951(-)